jgi:hypothetical protein
MTPLISLAIIGVLAALGVYISWRAGRLDRLHARVETARASLDAALVRRSSVALELASSGLLDPAASLLLADLAHDARSAGSSGGIGPAHRTDTAHRANTASRELAESDLTRALRAVFSQPDFAASLSSREGSGELLAELETTAHQVFLARTFYNGAVAATAAARGRWLARVLRLAGGAPMPEFFEIDDTLVPAGMEDQSTDMPHLSGG